VPAGALQGEKQLVSSLDAPIRLAGATLDQHRHICALFDSLEEEVRVLAPFIIDGIDRGEKASHFIDPALRERYINLLEQAGVPVRTALQRGQFSITSWHKVYLCYGKFDQFRLLEGLTRNAEKVHRDGYPRTRYIGHMEWALSGQEGCEQLTEYESRANNLLSETRDIGICVYNTSRFGASVIMDVLRTHPAAIIGGALRENPFYVPPAEYLSSFGESALDHLSS